MRRSRLAPAIALASAVTALGWSGAGSSEATPRGVTTPTTTAARPGTQRAPRVTLTKVGSATAPTAFATRSGDRTLYVAEQAGRVLAIRDGTTARDPVLDFTGRVATGSEQGLLGLVFSPKGDRVYVHYSALNGATKVEEYAFTPGRKGGGTADPGTRRTLLTLPQPQSNHNGGQLAFGPDGALYLGLGDGGSAGDAGDGHAPEGNAQSPDTLLGKIVRFDPATRRPRIFASGLRNPWRFSFDRANDDLWIGDVGQDDWEEIDRVPFADAKGSDFGWPLVEGTHPFRVDSAPRTVAPVYEIDHATGACAVIGGYVYRGTRIPALQGSYLYSDNCDGRIRSLRINDAGDVTRARRLGVRVFEPTSFGEDGNGDLYVLSASDGIFRFDPA